MSAPPATVLERIIAETRAEIERRKRAHPEPPHSSDAPAVGEVAATHGFARALAASGIGVIAEFKRRSPSAGTFASDPRLDAIVDAYRRGGAVALSILTEGPNFGGSLEDLQAARAVCELPLLRKDFVIDEYQLHEALAAGADAVLLIVAALEAPALTRLHAVALELGLDVLVEVHDRAELEVALEVGARIIGINNRDLRDFSVDLARTETLLEHVPDAVAVVSESGISTSAQLCRLAERGVAAVLVGEALMRAADPASALRELRDAAG